MGHNPDGTNSRPFQHIESCLDYQAYIYPIDPNIPPSRYATICQRLTALGRAEEERMGVVYVHADWGFCVIPGHGFPNLRLNFFKEIPITRIQEIMAAICHAFEPSEATINQPRSNKCLTP